MIREVIDFREIWPGPPGCGRRCGSWASPPRTWPRRTAADLPPSSSPSPLLFLISLFPFLFLSFSFLFFFSFSFLLLSRPFLLFSIHLNLHVLLQEVEEYGGNQAKLPAVVQLFSSSMGETACNPDQLKATPSDQQTIAQSEASVCRLLFAVCPAD